MLLSTSTGSSKSSILTYAVAFRLVFTPCAIGWGNSLRRLKGRNSSLEHADDFMRLDPDLRIWRATARGLSSADRRVCHPKERVDIEDFWRVHNSGGSYGVLGGRRTPSGTLWADEVRLDERFQSEKLPQHGVNWKWLNAIKSFVKRLLGVD